jgi:hypothetical protein
MTYPQGTLSRLIEVALAEVGTDQIWLRKMAI